MQWFALGNVIKDESEQGVLLFLLQSMKCTSMCFDLSFQSSSVQHKCMRSRALNILNGYDQSAWMARNSDSETPVEK